MRFFILLMVIVIGVLCFLLYKMWKSSKEVKETVYESLRDPVVLQILVPRENDKTPLAAEQMFASIHGILEDHKKCEDVVSLEIVSTESDGIRFYIVSPRHLAKFIEGQVYAQYPNAEIEQVEDYIGKQVTEGQSFVSTGEVEMEKNSIFPIKTFRNFEVDPLAAITGAMSEMTHGEQAWLQIVIRPIANSWQSKSKQYISDVKSGKDPNGTSAFKVFMNIFKELGSVLTSPADAPAKEVVKLEPGQEEELSEIGSKMLKVGFEFKIRVVAKAPSQVQSEQILRDVIASFKQFTTAHLNNLVYAKGKRTAKEIYDDYLSRRLADEEQDILNIEELASVYHLPNISVETPNLAWSRARKLEPPMNLPLGTQEGVTIFGTTDYRDVSVEFGLKRRDRERHFYLLGKTGSGKSTLFKNMFLSDVMAGDGACFIDPHGDTVEELLDYIPSNRQDDVVYFNPTDVDHPVGFNMLELKDKSQRDLIADGVVEVFKKQFGDSWGPRLQYILTNTVSTALEAQGTTLLAVTRILIDSNYRKFILKQVNDPILYKFWVEEYAQMAQNNKLLTDSVSPIQNKVGRFISSAVTRNIIGQVKSTIDLREIMDNHKILFVNLAQGKLGEETASLLGGMIITRLQATAMERVDIPEEQRAPFYLYVDEFQNYATSSFAKILSEARKYKLDLTMTNQYIDQLPLDVQQAIFGNVGSLASFVVSQSDASILQKEFAPTVTADDLLSLSAYSMYVKLCIDGMTSVPFSAKSLPVRFQKFNNKEEIIRKSREKYGVPREEIEEKIAKWSSQTYSDKGNRSLPVKPAVANIVEENSNNEIDNSGENLENADNTDAVEEINQQAPKTQKKNNSYKRDRNKKRVYSKPQETTEKE